MALRNTKSSSISDMNGSTRSSSENKRKCATRVVYCEQKTEILECPFCSKKYPFRQKHNLEAHVRIHTAEKPYVCKKCKRGFSLKYSLDRHIRNLSCFHRQNGHQSNVKLRVPKKPAHTIASSKPGIRRTHKNTIDGGTKKFYHCEVCSKKCRSPSELQIHLKIHTGEKSFSCPVCKVEFTRRYALKIHALIHKRKKPFKCDTCDVGFREVSKLNWHNKLYHIGDNPKIPAQKMFTKFGAGVKVKARSSGYKCDVCSNKFATQNQLQTHSRFHSGAKPFSCKFCDRAFKLIDTLRKHTKRVHSGEKRFKCNKCDEKFTEKSQLRCHKVDVHGGPRHSRSIVRKRKYGRALNVRTGEKTPVVSLRSDDTGKSSTSETRLPLNYPKRLSPEERAQQWASFLTIFNAKISKI